MTMTPTMTARTIRTEPKTLFNLSRLRVPWRIIINSEDGDRGLAGRHDYTLAWKAAIAVIALVCSCWNEPEVVVIWNAYKTSTGIVVDLRHARATRKARLYERWALARRVQRRIVHVEPVT